MLKVILKVFVLFSIIACSAQTDRHEAINVLFGYGLHGSGDLRGYQYGIQYSRDFSKRWAWNIELGGSLHDAADDALTYEDDQGNTVDATLHHVIGGFQLGSGIKYHAIKTVNHNVNLEIIPLLRYQATSISDINATIYDPTFPFPVRNLVRLEPARTLAVGSSFRINYRCHISNDYIIGIGGAFQTDTNGDSILSALLSFGKRF